MRAHFRRVARIVGFWMLRISLLSIPADTLSIPARLYVPCHLPQPPLRRVNGSLCNRLSACSVSVNAAGKRCEVRSGQALPVDASVVYRDNRFLDAALVTVFLYRLFARRKAAVVVNDDEA